MYTPLYFEIEERTTMAEEEEVGSHAGTLDLTSGSGQADHAAHPDSSHRYSGPMVQQYKYPVVGFIVILALTITAIALGASSLAKSNAALDLATANEEAIVQTAEMMVQLQLLEQSAADAPPLSVNDPSSGEVVVIATPAVTPPLTTPKPTTQQPQPTDSPTETHPLNPKWFHTDHTTYQNLIENEGNTEFHSHLLAGLFCHQNSKDLCPLDVYCPNGQGSPPYLGGPPKAMGWEDERVKQWAAYKPENPTAENSASGGTWVQVGTIPEVDGGMDENGFGQCWTWDDWMSGAGGDIEDVWGEDHRSWILCCDMTE